MDSALVVEVRRMAHIGMGLGQVQELGQLLLAEGQLMVLSRRNHHLHHQILSLRSLVEKVLVVVIVAVVVVE